MSRDCGKGSGTDVSYTSLSLQLLTLLEGFKRLTSSERLTFAGVDQETFFSYLRDHPSTSSDPIVITSSSTFEAISSFYLRTAFTSSRVPYQLHLNVSEGVQLDQVAFTQLRLEFSDSSEVVLDHDDEGSRIVKLADAKEGKANLRWEKGQGVVVSGWTSSDVAGPISASRSRSSTELKPG